MTIFPLIVWAQKTKIIEQLFWPKKKNHNFCFFKFGLIFQLKHFKCDAWQVTSITNYAIESKL